VHVREALREEKRRAKGERHTAKGAQPCARTWGVGMGNQYNRVRIAGGHARMAVVRVRTAGRARLDDEAALIVGMAFGLAMVFALIVSMANEIVSSLLSMPVWFLVICYEPLSVAAIGVMLFLVSRR